MSSQTPPLAIEAKGRLAPIRVLAEWEKDRLILSPQGFLLIFQDRSPELLARQLRDFDAVEWRQGEEMTQIFSHELEGLASLERMRDASDLLAACTPDALALINQEILSLSGSNIEYYNFIYSTHPFRVKARIQALTVLPMLKWEFIKITTVTDRVRRLIDEGKSVWDAYLEVYPGKVSILRRLASTQSNPAPWRGDLAGLLALLDPLPPEKVPSNDEEWNAFNSIHLALMLNYTECYLRRNRERLALKLRWLEDVSRMGWVKAYQKLAALEGGLDAVRDAFDFLNEIGEAGDYLALQAGESCYSLEVQTQRSSERWLRAPESFGMFRILEWSARWHRLFWEEAGIADSAGGNSNAWPLLLAEPLELSPSVRAVSLGTTADLAAEGTRMQHCVGGYSLSCSLGDAHIISLRDAEGQSLSTLQIALDQSGKRECKIIQHKALRNRTPDGSLRALEGKLIAAINQTADFPTLAAWREKSTTVHNLRYHKDPEAFGRGFSQRRMDRLAAVLGSDRLMRLFQSQAAA